MDFRDTGVPVEITDHLKGRDVIVFDGECVLCSGFFQFVVKHDTAERFHFVTAQSPMGAAFYTALGLPIDQFDTNLIVIDGKLYGGIDSFGATMRALGLPWALLSVVDWLPRMIKTPLYRWIATNRYRIWGRRDTCMLPTPELRARFLDT